MTTASLGTPTASSALAPEVLPAPGAALNAAVLSSMTDLQDRIAATQRSFLEQQTTLHQQFLALRQRTLDDLVTSFDSAKWVEPSFPSEVSEEGHPAIGHEQVAGPSPNGKSQQLAAAPAPAAPVPTTPIAIVAPETVTPTEEVRAEAPIVASAATARTPAATVATPAAKIPASAHAVPTSSARASTNGELPGLKISRRELEVLAAGKISSIFGSMFERQDGYARQTRMPEPPFLLADRVTGIDAEPGSMGVGTIWTETDVTNDSWYLHRGRMPGGLMIEAGQADLLLISWLGIDFLNRNERVYRLLGCELTYRSSLPRPGDTLAYDIHVDGHAQQGDVRLFFFHYDCRVDDEVRLEVRHGQAGFFTDEELANSAGVLWSPEEETPEAGRLDLPHALTEHRSFTPERLQAFSEGRILECMGPGFELAEAHTLSPTIQDGRMLLLDRITDFDPQGGAWKRGYLRATTALQADSWIFEGHFKNDPCMPGTLMLEGCFQTMAFYLAAHGFTLERDGWRFEPVPDETYLMRCRGQAIPTSKELTYELFVHEIIAGPEPTLYADLLCTVDGLKAFHARRLGLRLVPEWPLNIHPEWLDQPFPGGERPTGGEIARHDDFAFDYASLLACAWGQPSHAFGEMYRVFDSHRQVARLPGPPYHFMSRIASIEGEMGRFEPGAVLEAHYDVPPQAWYFTENGYPTMPFAVLMEAGLQPCGWLASYIGSALTTDVDLQFRNLDGTGTATAEVAPTSGTLRSKVKLVATSSSAGVLIVRFEVEMFDDHRPIFNMATAFGFFPAAAMQNQVGLPATPEEREWLERPCDFEVDLTIRPARYCSSPCGLAGRRLLMLDRVTGFWPEAGKAGLGRLRCEKDVDPSEWFFKAHFFQDPVQPGSLGIEAMIQALQFYMLHTGMTDGIENPRFESLATDRALTWKYRGQVLPTNRLITTELEIVEVGTDDRGAYAVAEAFLWVDGKRIYSATQLGMRIVGDLSPLPAETVHETEDAPTLPSETVTRDDSVLAIVNLAAEDEEVLDPEMDAWIADHCPTWTLPALPMMSLVDRLAAAAHKRRKDFQIVGLEDVRIARWVAFPDGPLRLRTEVIAEERQGSELGAVDVQLSVWRDAATPALSRFEVAATGRVLMARNFCLPPTPLPPLPHPTEQPDPYASGALVPWTGLSTGEPSAHRRSRRHLLNRRRWRHGASGHSPPCSARRGHPRHPP